MPHDIFNDILGDKTRRADDDEDPPLSLADLYRLAAGKLRTLFAQQPRNLRLTTTASIAAAGTLSRNLTWPKPLPSANYCVQVTAGAGLAFQSVTNLTPEGCTVTVRNTLAAAVPAGATVHVTAVPD